MGDAVAPIGTGVDVGSAIVADMPAFGNVTTQSGGVAGSLAGTITSAGVMTLTLGAGTTATGQFVSEISVEYRLNKNEESSRYGSTVFAANSSDGSARGAKLPTGLHDLQNGNSIHRDGDHKFN